MALTLQISISTACAGGNHFFITGTPTGAYSPQTVAYSQQDLAAPVVQADIEPFMRTLIRLYYNQISTHTPGQIKASIQAKVLDLTVS